MKRNVFFKCVMAFAVVVFGLLAVGCGNSEAAQKATIDENIKKVDDALKKGDYAEAYAIADQMLSLFGDGESYKIYAAGCDLNKKILTNEIATNVDEGNTARIILCIKERARFNDYGGLDYGQKKAEIEMLKYAIQLANTVENDDMVKKLQKALDTWEEK